MTRFQPASLAIALIPILSSLAGAATVPLNPSQDNTIIQRTDPAGQLSNGLGDVFVGRTNQDGQGPATISIRRGLVRFDVAASIPAGSIITGASLTMRDVMGLNGDPVVRLHNVLQDWGEGTSFQNGGMGAAATDGDATWLYRFYNAATPALSPTWSTPGGDFNPVSSASAVITDDQGALQLFSWSSAAMVADVQSWLDNPAGNFGWLLQGDESMGQTAKRLNSGESAVPPVLSITYVIPEPSSGLLWGLGALLILGRRAAQARGYE